MNKSNASTFARFLDSRTFKTFTEMLINQKFVVEEGTSIASLETSDNKA